MYVVVEHLFLGQNGKIFFNPVDHYINKFSARTYTLLSIVIYSFKTSLCFGSDNDDQDLADLDNSKKENSENCSTQERKGKKSSRYVKIRKQ